jgi:hypothetical protein
MEAAPHFLATLTLMVGPRHIRTVSNALSGITRHDFYCLWNELVFRLVTKRIYSWLDQLEEITHPLGFRVWERMNKRNSLASKAQWRQITQQGCLPAEDLQARKDAEHSPEGQK